MEEGKKEKTSTKNNDNDKKCVSEGKKASFQFIFDDIGDSHSWRGKQYTAYFLYSVNLLISFSTHIKKPTNNKSCSLLGFVIFVDAESYNALQTQQDQHNELVLTNRLSRTYIKF